MSAVLVFINTFKDKKTTHDLYIKEVERFMLWLEFKKIPLSGLRPSDWNDYLDFLDSPTPLDVWCGFKQRKFLTSGKINSEWRVFVNKMKNGKAVNPGLSKTSILKVKRIISSMFTFLMKNGYTLCNPTAIGVANNQNSEKKVLFEVELVKE